MTETVKEVISGITNIVAFVFIISTMLSTGLSLTIRQIVQPLKNVRFVVLSIVANFVIVPTIAYIIITFVPLDRPLQIGLIIVAFAAGNPTLPKVAQISRADVASSVGLMVMLVVLTIIILPVALPLLLPGVKVSIWGIAQNLIIMMLVPLVIALFVRARWTGIAQRLLPYLNKTANFSLIFLIIFLILGNLRYIIGLFGSGGILSSFLIIGIAFGAGYLLGGPTTGKKRVLCLGTGQRNIAAAMLVAIQNFNEEVLVMVLVFSVVTMLVALPIAGEFARRSKKAEASRSA
jgi:BASS family bile acid:Na+ symporter